MKEALLKIKTRLKTQVGYLADTSYITTDGIISSITAFPAVGIKDGPSPRKHVGGVLGAGGEFDKKITVKVTAFVEMLADDESAVMGDGIHRGILDVMEDITEALDGFDMGDGYTAPLISSGEEESQVLADEDEQVYIQMQTATFTCSKQA